MVTERGQNKKMKKQLFYIILFISAIGFAQEPLVKAVIDTTNIRIGEQFQLKIMVNKTQNVIIPKIDSTRLGKLEIISEDKIDTIKNTLIKKYILTGFDSGAYYIPQQQIYINNQAHLTDSLLINVATIAIDTTKQKPFPIKAIKGEPIIFDDYKNYMYWGLIALAIIGFLLYYFVFNKKTEEEEEYIPTIPPYEEAIQKLHQLDEKLLWQNNKIKKYYSELTEIIRSYIERELKVPALEITTDELINTLTNFYTSGVIITSDETIKKLKDLLQEADLVKFAKSKPLALEIEGDRKDAEEVVNHLKPKPVEIVETKEEKEDV